MTRDVLLLNKTMCCHLFVVQTVVGVYISEPWSWRILTCLHSDVSSCSSLSYKKKI